MVAVVSRRDLSEEVDWSSTFGVTSVHSFDISMFTPPPGLGNPGTPRDTWVGTTPLGTPLDTRETTRDVDRMQGTHR